MGDFPKGESIASLTSTKPIISTFDPACCPFADYCVCSGSTGAAGTWPVANRAIYTAIYVDNPIMVLGFLIDVSIQSGNVDVGLYDEKGKYITSVGSTAVGVAGAQYLTLGSTLTLMPGLYFIGMAVDNITASFFRFNVGNAVAMQVLGIQQQVTAFPLPTTSATFGNPASIYAPYVGLCQNSVI